MDPLQTTVEGTIRRGPPPTWLAVVALILISLLVFVPALRAGFVYDDRAQIVENPMLSPQTSLAIALTTDVWAFRAANDTAASSYWRPTFVLWMRAHAALFGTDHAQPWHLSLLLLHALVVILVYLLFGRLGLTRNASALVAALFAAHPTRVESVAWISGATDPLCALFVLLTMLCLLRAGPRWWRSPWAWLALLCYALALGCKEIAVMLLLLLPLVDSAPSSWAQRVMRSLPFALLAAGYLIARQQVLAGGTTGAPDSVGVWEQALSVPSLLLFYLGQSMFPLDLSPLYGLRPVRISSVPWAMLSAQLIVLAVLLAIAAWAARRNRLLGLGLLWFVVFLAPAFNIHAFPSEQIVHDRYLYLPLFGLLLAIAAALQRAGPGARPWFAASAIAIVAVLGWSAHRYTSVWADEARLWQHAVARDPGSASAWTLLAEQHWREGRGEAASAAATRALDIAPLTSAFLIRSEARMAGGEYAAAENDLRQVVAVYPDHRPAVERLAALYQAQRRYAEAQVLLVKLLALAPGVRCSTQVNLAILRYLQGDRGGARIVLAKSIAQNSSDVSGSCVAAHFHLANLLLELGDRMAARRSIERYLTLTEGANDRTTRRLRAAALDLRQRLHAAH